jgi:hypothetical protein
MCETFQVKPAKDHSSLLKIFLQLFLELEVSSSSSEMTQHQTNVLCAKRFSLKEQRITFLSTKIFLQLFLELEV